MAKDPSREAHFPAIEKKYGEKMAYWFKVMAKLEGKKYPEQIAHLRENYGFSQAHANALVMFSRGSESSKRFATHADFYKSVTPEQAKTMKAIFKALPSLNLGANSFNTLASQGAINTCLVDADAPKM